ncbi:MAG: RNA methyltransferase [Phycisphaerales bacterium]|nr:RNA methyltransferase [Phycisphaerales bacterium]
MSDDCIAVNSPDDPRLWPYMNTRDRELAAIDESLFIAEGEHLVRRLLASRLRAHSVLVTSRKVDEIAPLAAGRCPVYVAPDSIIDAILGFKFHSGVIGCGRRPVNPPLDSLINAAGRTTLVVCPETHNSENLGSIIRIAAGLGADGMLLGQRCCDPFFRRVVRVSMGAVFTLPIVCSTDLRADLSVLRQRWNVELIATVANDASAETLSAATTRAERTAILFGSESQGLDRYWLDVCNRRLTIPMHLGTDSLNVAVAAGIILWHLARK